MEDSPMNEIDVVGGKALGYFNAGHNCAQSVLLAMADHWNVKNELIPKIAAPFGGGIGRYGSVCGALTGAAMALGLKYGTNEPSAEKRQEAYERARALCQQFKRNHGSILCRDLIGYDLSNPEEMEKARRNNAFREKCDKYVKSAVEILLKTDDH
jgi:C_GCAxxG_C_C family probable redox protein